MNLIEKLEIMQAVTRLRKAGLLRTIDAKVNITHETVEQLGRQQSSYLGFYEDELEATLAPQAIKPVTLRKYEEIKRFRKTFEHKITLTVEVLDLPTLELLLDGEKWGHPK